MSSIVYLVSEHRKKVTQAFSAAILDFNKSTTFRRFVWDFVKTLLKNKMELSIEPDNENLKTVLENFLESSTVLFYSYGINILCQKKVFCTLKFFSLKEGK